MIHILYRGLPLCEFSLALPGDWPRDHKWVSYDDREHHDYVDCNGCKEQKDKIDLLRGGR